MLWGVLGARWHRVGVEGPWREGEGRASRLLHRAISRLGWVGWIASERFARYFLAYLGGGFGMLPWEVGGVCDGQL
jgi:hypothetical protein